MIKATCDKCGEELSVNDFHVTHWRVKLVCSNDTLVEQQWCEKCKETIVSTAYSKRRGQTGDQKATAETLFDELVELLVERVADEINEQE